MLKTTLLVAAALAWKPKTHDDCPGEVVNAGPFKIAELKACVGTCLESNEMNEIRHF